MSGTRPPGWRDRSEAALGRLARRSYRHPWRALVACAALTAALLAGAAALRIDSSMESFLSPEDAIRVAYDDFRDRFGSDEYALLLVRGEDVFERGFLERLAALHAALADEVPHTDAVESLINARVTRGEGDELIVEELFERWPESDAELEALRARALANPLYRDLLISADGRHALITLETLPPAGEAHDPIAGFDDEPAADADAAHARVLSRHEIDEVVAALERIAERHRADGFEIWIAGGVPFTQRITALIQHEMGLFTGVAVVAIGALLALLFRRVAGVVLPLGVALLSLGAVFGFMGWLDMPLTPISQLFPSFLLAVGTSGVVHLLAVFFPLFDEGVSAEDAVAEAFRHSGLAIAMASATTAGGLLSFRFVELEAFAHFGVAAPFGVALSVVYTGLLVPALLAIRPPRRLAGRRFRGAVFLDRALDGLAALACRRPLAVLIGWAALLAVALPAALHLTPSHHPLHWLGEDDRLRLAVERVDASFGGSLGTELLIDTGRPDGLKAPGVLQAIAELQEAALQLGDGVVHVSKAVTVADVMRETHAALHGNDRAYYRIPDDPGVVAQELLLFEMSGPDELAELADAPLAVARVHLLTSFSDARDLQPLLRELEARARRIGPGPGTALTGVTAIQARTFEAMLEGMLRSYGVALLVIAPLMVLFLGSLRWGLLCMVPNIVPIVIGLGFLYAAGLPLDTFSALIGSIAIGIAVDDTLHFMHGFQRSYARSGDPEQAIRETLRRTGRALLTTSAALTTGFLTFGLATMTSVVVFGVVSALIVATALLADVLLAPALVLWITRAGATSAEAEGEWA